MQEAVRRNHLTARDVTEAARLYREGASLREVAQAVGAASKSRLRQHLIARGVEMRRRGPRPPSQRAIRAMVHLYVAHGLSTLRIAALLRTNAERVRQHLMASSVNLRSRGARRVEPTCGCDLPEILAARRRQDAA